MGKAIHHFFSHNIGLKFLSLIASLLLWIIVVNLQNPVSTMTISNIPITILNETYFAEHGQIATVESDLRISVTVSGTRSVVEKATADDFKATIDYLSASTEEGRVKIQVTALDRKMTITQQSASYVKLHIQDIITKEFQIRVETQGEPASPYLLEADPAEMVIQPSSITVRGPQEWVEQITEAVVVLNTENAKEDVSGRGKEIELRNSAGEILSFSEEDSISISARMMTQLVVPVYKKISVKLNPQIEFSGTEDYIVESVSISPSSIVVYGNELKLSPITSIDLTEQITLEEEGVITRTYQVDEICKEIENRISGITRNLSEEEAVLTIQVVKRVETSFPFNNEVDIQLINQDQDFDYEFQYPDKAMEIVVAGTQKAIDALTLSRIHFEVDVTDCEEGKETLLDLVIKAPDEVTILSAPTQIPVIKKAKPVPASDSETASNEIDPGKASSQTSGEISQDQSTQEISPVHSSVHSEASQGEVSQKETEKEESSDDHSKTSG